MGVVVQLAACRIPVAFALPPPPRWGGENGGGHSAALPIPTPASLLFWGSQKSQHLHRRTFRGLSPSPTQAQFSCRLSAPEKLRLLAKYF